MRISRKRGPTLHITSPLLDGLAHPRLVGAGSCRKTGGARCSGISTLFSRRLLASYLYITQTSLTSHTTFSHLPMPFSHTSRTSQLPSHLATCSRYTQLPSPGRERERGREAWEGGIWRLEVREGEEERARQRARERGWGWERGERPKICVYLQPREKGARAGCMLTQGGVGTYTRKCRHTQGGITTPKDTCDPTSGAWRAPCTVLVYVVLDQHRVFASREMAREFHPLLRQSYQYTCCCSSSSCSLPPPPNYFAWRVSDVCSYVGMQTCDGVSAWGLGGAGRDGEGRGYVE